MGERLGQHWLTDTLLLEEIVTFAGIKSGDHVLEVGPGLGTLTRELLAVGADVTAVELDDELYEKLVAEAKTLETTSSGQLDVVHSDILTFDLGKLPKKYKVVANIPYYLTGKLLRRLMEAENTPSSITILIQKEVAERVAAAPGQMSLISVSAQLFGNVRLGPIVPADFFDPPPKVDSQVVKIERHAKPMFPGLDSKSFFCIIRAGFGERRKKLRSSLAGGLHIPKGKVDNWLAITGLDANARAQELSLDDWYELWKNRPI